MNFVEPIRDKHKLDELKDYFLERPKRDYMLYFLGMNLTLRITDLLKLRVCDLRDKDYFTLVEKKTGKYKKIPVLPHVKKEIRTYVKDMKDSDYLFRALYRKENKPIDRSQAWRIITAAAKACNLDRIGTHSFRKTYGYHYYQSTKDVVSLMKIFNHHDQNITLRYIGIEQDQMLDNMKKFGGIK